MSKILILRQKISKGVSKWLDDHSTVGRPAPSPKPQPKPEGK